MSTHMALGSALGGSHQALVSLFVVTAVTAAVPLLAKVLPGRPPQVVLLLIGGVIIGPACLHLAHRGDIQLISDLGLGFLFLLAGYEINPLALRGPIGRRAIGSWVASLLLAGVAVWALFEIGFLHAPVPIAIGLTTTALGSLLPIMRDHANIDSRLTRAVIACGAVGELCPIVAIAVVLGAYNSWIEVCAIIGVLVLGAVMIGLGRRARGSALERLLAATAHGTAQTSLRWTLLILIGLLVLTSTFGIDSVLGAFLAGAILRQWTGQHEENEFDRKLDCIGHGVFIPIFFVASGMSLDLDSVLDHPLRVLIFFALLLLVRGAPVLLLMRGVLPIRQRWQLLFLSATTLPLLVAVTDIGVRDGHMLAANAAALVGAGILSMLIGPMVGLRALTAPRDASAHSSHAVTH